ncbi:MAG: putative bifunctional reductase [Verrucomicrobiaceae bacterium]|nr:putative bifunctional reductase [Verrucomicrobiaceae bacterium]
MATANKTVATVCPYCGVGCGMLLEVADNKVVKVSGDKSHPTNFGRLCTKGATSAGALRNSGRLEKAYIRQQRDKDPTPLAMDAAIADTAQRLRKIIDEHGPDAFAFYVSGQMSLEAQYLCNKLIKGFIGTNQIESNSRLCMASAGSGYKLSLGSDGPPGSYQDFDHADVFFVIGANMADCHPILFLRMMDRIKAGAKLIVVDPRRNATADKAHLFLQIKPGTDLALLNGLLHLLQKNNHTNAEFIAEFTEGWEAMPEFLADYTPGKVAEITGLNIADICQAAELIGNAANWMSCWTMGLNQSTHGTWNTNAICNLHLATGAICRLGSGPFSLTGQPNAMGGREMGYMGPGLPGQRSVLVEDDRHFVEQAWGVARDTLHTRLGGGTVAMFDTMQSGQIKACWIICTNPVATVPNRKNVIAALQACELVITQDAFLDTETNRYADILLPGALWAEAEGVMINSERNLTLMQHAIDPPGDAMADWQIIARVACAMGYAHAFTYASATDVFDEIKKFWNPNTGYDIRGASYSRLRETSLQWPCPPADNNDRHPIRYLNDGVSQKLRRDDDGAQPCLTFATASGKGVFFPRPHMDAAEMPDPDFPIVLNTGRLQHQWHTMTKTGKIATLNKLNPGPFVELHPEDAAALNICDKDRVEIRSRRGRAILPAVVTDRVRAGNCFAPFHWNDVFGEDLAINAVTSDAIDPISQQPEFKFCAVMLCKVAEEIPVVHIDADANADTEDSNVAIATKTDMRTMVHTDTRTATITEIDTMQITALAQLLGLEVAQAPVLDAQEQLYLQGFLLGLSSEAGRGAGGVPTLPANAPLQPARRILIDGMLAGLFSRSGTSNYDAQPLAYSPPQSPMSSQSIVPVIAKTSVTILWASQTGNVESFADQCAEHFKASDFDVTSHSMDAFAPADLSKAQNLLLLTSTFGDGDPPDNGAALWHALQTDNAPALERTRYGVLAFGDSSYGQFCGFGRKLDARLEALGAQRLSARIDCDSDFETPAKNWLHTISAALIEGKGSANDAENVVEKNATKTAVLDSSTITVNKKSEPAYTKKSPFASRLIMNQRLNGDGSSKETRHFAFALDDSFQYEAGDALGVWPSNCAELVDEFIDVLGLPKETPVALPELGEFPLHAALCNHYEIAQPSRAMLEAIAARSAVAEPLPALLKPERENELKDWLWGKQLVDVLREHPAAKFNPTDLQSLLRRLQPRLYSISSSPKAFANEVHLTVSAVRYHYRNRQRKGVSSTFLADRVNDSAVSLFLQKSAHFRPPSDPTVPMIMVGPGTGVAPFRAFLHERQATGATGKNWLFFGEQHAATDFYYRDELEKWRADKFLTRLDLAFSRDQTEKIYVQDRMCEHGAELWRWLQDGAHFYVCGDASRMAKDVDRMLQAVVAAHGEMTAAKAADYVCELAAAKRYVRDVY